MPKVTVASQRRARARASSQPYTKAPAPPAMTLLPDPNRPDLAGTGLQKPAQRQKLMRKKAFLESIGESAAAAAVDVGQRSQKAANKGSKEGEGGLTPSWGDVRGLLDSLTSSSTGSGGGKATKATTSGSFQKIKSNAAKQMIATKEVERLKHITTHPVFKANPHTAIREHLRTQLAASAAAARAAGKGGEGGEVEEARRHMVESPPLKKRGGEGRGDGGRRGGRQGIPPARRHKR